MIRVNFDYVFERIYGPEQFSRHRETFYYFDIGGIKIAYIKEARHTSNTLYKLQTSMILCNKLILNYGRGYNELNNAILNTILTCDKTVNIPTVISKIKLSEKRITYKLW